MRVSSRYALMLASVASSLLATAAASAQSHAPTPPSPPPPSNCCTPTPPPPPCCTHGTGPHISTPVIAIGGPSVHVGGSHISVGGVTVNNSLNVNVTAQASASASALAISRGNAGATVFYGGGGYIRSGSAPAATALSDLRLAGQHEYELIEEERTRIIEEWRLVRAVCIDDTGTPHPASRPDPEERVNPDFEGEIYRCMAGTALHATLGWREEGEDRFDGASLQCQKGEALRYGQGGQLFCATEEARRNCNERSLLRLHGPGVKLIYYRFEETYMETVEHRSERIEQRAMTLMLNGGVGGYH